jgi:hypothetical protein
MVGTINLALTQQLDQYGQPLSGGQLFIIQAGTTSTPQNPYQDTALTIPIPNPIVLDSAGRIPMFYLADGQIKVRLQDVNGVVKFVADNLLVIGPSVSGGGGGPSVDPTTVLATGDVKIRYDTAVLTGWVRCNGKTIGSATSGGTELANISAQNLFQFLWQVDTTLVVSSGRGVSAAADWAANKTIQLPDFRARCLTALSDMGNTDVGLLTGINFTHGNTVTLGAQCGFNPKIILPATSIPAHNHNVYLKDPSHIHTGIGVGSGQTPSFEGAASPYNAVLSAVLNAHNPTDSSPTGITIGSIAGTANDNHTANTGAGGAFEVTNPMMLITVYLKL